VVKALMALRAWWLAESLALQPLSYNKLGSLGSIINIEDEGQGFDLESVPDPTAEENLEADHGRGILLMRVYMDEVVYSQKGNRVTLVKMLDNANEGTEVAGDAEKLAETS